MLSAYPERVDCFSVFVAAEPAALPRVLNVFSLFGVIPERCHSAWVEADRDQLVVDVQVAGLPAGQAEQLARRLDRVITVTQVLHSEKRRAGPPEVQAA
jgi:acetolactate synthase small subunit